jgi:hypothetical protein
VPFVPPPGVPRATPAIAILGAFDRFNFGDLLFPVVAERVLQATRCPLPITFYTTVQSDLRHVGAYRTHAIKNLFRPGALADDSVVLVAGGEMLDARWTPTLETVLSGPLAFVVRRIRNRCGEDASDAFCRWLAGTSLPAPWMIAPTDFGTRVRIAYNCVGGSQVRALPAPFRQRVLETLSRADFLSVRDTQTQAELEAAGLAGRVRLAPDSAILISRILPLVELQELVSPTAKRIVRRHGGGYLCFQINKRLGQGQGKQVAKELDAIARRHHLGIVLLANGRARNHEDHVALAEVQAALAPASELAGGEPSIYDILFLIASARVYAGTSLHGSITALAYGVPHVGLTRQVPKLEAFLQTWDIPEQRACVPLERLREQIDVVLQVPQAVRDQRREELAQGSLQNFASLFAATSIQASTAGLGELLPAPACSADGDPAAFAIASAGAANRFFARGVLP